MKTIKYTNHGTSSAGLPCKEKKQKFGRFYFAGCRSNIIAPYKIIITFNTAFLSAPTTPER
jgi:hypothetical protein